MPRKLSTSQSRVRNLTVFAPVPEESLDLLTERLRGLQQQASPFAAIRSTHFARLAVLARDTVRPQPRARGMRWTARLIDLITHAGRSQRPDPPSLSYLVFSATYDAEPGRKDDAQYLEQLRTGLGETADQIWGLCSDYPGWTDSATFLAFFTERLLSPPGYVFSAADDEPTVGQIQHALRLRQQVIELALDTDGLADEQLLKQLRQVFDKQVQNDPVDQPVRPLPLDAEPALLDPPTTDELLSSVGGGAGSPPTTPDLGDVQNLVVSGYPKHQVSRHLLLRITDPADARRWLTQMADLIPTAGWAQEFVDRFADSSAEVDSADAEAPVKGDSPEFAVHLALSYSGLVGLGLPEADLSGFASEFRAGMASREPGLTPGRGRSTWQAPFAGEAPDSGVHILVLLSATDVARLEAELGNRPDLVPGRQHGLQAIATFDGARIRRPDNDAAADRPGFVEHFGFADGISQPRIHGVTSGGGVAELPPGEALLGYQDVDGDISGAGLRPSLARNGSYLVYRKLEQDVPAFEGLTRELAGQLELSQEGASNADLQELAAAKLMGRWRDGTPVTLAPDGSDPALAGESFGYQKDDAEGFRCPVGAHVRRANPRDSRPVDPDPEQTPGGHTDLETALALRHRMLRRGIPYGRAVPRHTSHPQAIDTDEERGLLFVALVGDIRRQFEFVQAHWLSDGNAFRLGTDRDILSGAAQADTKITVQAHPPVFLRPTTPLITCRGGEYFFLPGLTALRRISAGA